MAIFNLFSKNIVQRQQAKVDLAKSLCRLVGWEIETPTKLQKLVFLIAAPYIVKNDTWSFVSFFPSHCTKFLISRNDYIKSEYYKFTDFMDSQIQEDELTIITINENL
ncbi:hypothetical protein [Campylobacter sp. RM12651]|uniref:hypothetical protein n=1 Tax=Campylobacter sp. RM12651 TaxID=1660079 RepID=UPI001EFC2CF2|nr:hypothetical protein [Campylobacter sp. RM12651]ULO03739.1 hypothetical protein AVBRAN_1284 [Campylobacter sp. RM12651]